MKRHFALFMMVLLAVLSTARLGAQHVPERVPRPGEQRFNAFQYIGSHNSFQRPRPGSAVNLIPLREQIDDWGMRHLELDVWYKEGQWFVFHNCADISGATTLHSALNEVANSQAVANGETFVVVNFDMGNMGSKETVGLCFDVLPSDWITRLEDFVLLYFDAEQVYTSEEFVTVDDRKWPSQQELARRDKVIAFNALGTGWRPGNPDPPFFFAHSPSDNPAETLPNHVEIRSGEHTDTYNLGEKFTSLYYPSAGTCVGESFNQWSTAVSNGFTFPTTYCLTDLDRHNHLNIHPPNPFFVRHPLIDPTMLGTRGKPARSGIGLGAGLLRLNAHQDIKGPSMFEVRIEGGTYDVSTFAPITPMRVTAASRLVRDSGSGPVRITK